MAKSKKKKRPKFDPYKEFATDICPCKHECCQAEYWIATYWRPTWYCDNYESCAECHGITPPWLDYWDTF